MGRLGENHMKEQILKAFWHRGRKTFVPWLATELANRTKLDQEIVIATLKSLAYDGLAKSRKIDAHGGTNTWTLTTTGKEEAAFLLRAEEIVRAR